ncbi:MAG: preprotein translocase subunit SecA [Thermoguttaceae bacterium]
MMRLLNSLIPLTNVGRLARWELVRDQINAREKTVKQLSDSELRKAGLSLRYRARSGETLAALLPEMFTLVREAGCRTLNMRHFDVQILGGIAMFHRSIVEMQTGEGKTLTATLPMCLYALRGKGALLATVNDYLAQRDARWMEPIYQALGLKVGIIQSEMPQEARRDAYQCDVTYGTAKEFGFDFLRDRLLLRKIQEGEHDLLGALLGVKKNTNEKPVQRDRYFALVDEADSILIDEASTPLIISALPTEEEKREVDCYYWAAEVVSQFHEKIDYTYDHEKKKVELTQDGRLKARKIGKPESLHPIGLFTIYEFIERAIKVDREHHRDEHYVVRDGEIVIVDEFTGRLGEGRKWRDGIHQAVEAKEGVSVTVATGQAARITVQDYFVQYDHLAGMTGTGTASAAELRHIYKCHVIPVPTNHPPKRVRWPTQIFASENEKWNAILLEIVDVHKTGRPILIGTRTIDASLLLSKRLKESGIEHQILNAYQVAEEAEIVAAAGQLGKVTVSTNMAGRGTDIKVSDEVRQLGGLHVICSEMHESARIDRQLIGRCGRQGDPGTFRQFLSLEDDLLKRAHGPKKVAKMISWLRRFSIRGIPAQSALFRKAQKKVERKNFRNRKVMLYYEKERKKIQRSMGQDPYLDTPN